MDHAENTSFNLDRLLVDPVSATSISIGCIIAQLIARLLRLLQKNNKAQRRCKKECEELRKLLISIHPDDVLSIEDAVRLCKEGGIEMNPVASWLGRLKEELEETEGLLEQFLDNGGVLKYITGDGLPKKITTQKETLTKLANELALLHVGLQNLLLRSTSTKLPRLQIHRDAFQVPYSFSSNIRRLPSFKNHRYHDTEYISVCDSFDRPSSSSFCRLPSFERHCHPDAEFFIRDGLPFTRVPVSHPHFCSQVSFSRLPVANPHYFKHVESEY